MLRQNRQSSLKDKPVGGTGVNTFLSSVAVFLSAIALGITGFTLVQNFQLQQSFSQLNTSVQNSPATPEPVTNSAPESLPLNNTATVPSPQPTQQVNTEIQPGQLVQSAFGGKAQVELLAVNRIQDPETGKRNVVNVQMRFRALQEMGASHAIALSQTKARQIETNETYESYDVVANRSDQERSKSEGTEIDRSRKERSSGGILMVHMELGSSVDGYVWMVVPEEIETIDLFVPHTEAFMNVSIVE
jgi:hypothetical protein